MNEQTYRKMVERFTRFLESQHLKKTPERYAILARVMKQSPHFEADDLHRALDESGFHVSRATVYNTVELLCRCGVLRRLMFDARKVRYEVADSNHLHLVCSQCGALAEAEAPGMEHLMERHLLEGFTPSYYTMCVYGLCADCRRDFGQKSAAESETPD